MRLRAATRGSALALWQTNRIAELLSAADPDIEVDPVVVSTAGDRDTDTPIHAIGGKGVFVKEVQAAVLDGRADIAVHSAKDLPALTPDELVIAAYPDRADPRDALVGISLEDLPTGARIGTGSVRRRVQLRELRPDVECVELRGNIETRLERVGDLDAIVMAAAALDRLKLRPERVERLPIDTMTPQVGQGALAVECRRDAGHVRTALAAIDDAVTRRLVTAERAFLEELGGDCTLPAGAHASTLDGEILLLALLADDESGEVHRLRRTGTDGVLLGRGVAADLRARAAG